MTPGRYLYIMRARKADTQRQVAQNAGISATYLNDIERGARVPRGHDLLRRLAQATGADYHALCYYIGIVPEDLQGRPSDPIVVLRAWAAFVAVLQKN